MKPTPPKRRVLTAREKLMLERHTRLVKVFPKCFAVKLEVGVQSFAISGEFSSKSRAEWTRKMLAIAIARIEL